MLNTNLFNSQLLNGHGRSYSTVTTETTGDNNVTFNNYPLNSSAFTIVDIQGYDSGPIRVLNLVEKPRSNGKVKVGDYDSEKHIIVTGFLKYDTAEDFENAKNTIRQKLFANSGTLIVDLHGRKEAFTNVSLYNQGSCFEGRLPFPRNRSPFILDFIATNPPYGQDLYYTTLYNETGATSASSTFEVDNTGSANTFMYISVKVNSTTSWGDITITNNTTGRELFVDDAMIAADRLIVDGENSEILIRNAGVDNTNLDWEGQFIELVPGDNEIQIDITSSAHNVDIFVKTKFFYK